MLDPEFGDYLESRSGRLPHRHPRRRGRHRGGVDRRGRPALNPFGAKGIGEIGIVGTAAAIANAVYHATGIRVRDLPIRLDKLLPGLIR